MENKKNGFDIVGEVLEEALAAYPVSSFLISLYKQYRERGSLSKKQIEGLHSKASAIEGLAPGKLATLEALIKKMKTKYKSEVTANTPLYQKDEVVGDMIAAILQKYPLHKRVIFLQSKFNNNEILTPADIADLKRFMQLVK